MSPLDVIKAKSAPYLHRGKPAKQKALTNGSDHTIVATYGSKMAAKHKAKIQTPHGPRTCFEARIERNGRQPLIARFGETPLHRQKRRRSPTVNRSGSTIRTRNSLHDSSRISARSASNPARWKSTTSASSPTSANPDRYSPSGPRPWPTGDAKP